MKISEVPNLNIPRMIEPKFPKIIERKMNSANRIIIILNEYSNFPITSIGSYNLKDYGKRKEK
jgi:hypothetical protein